MLKLDDPKQQLVYYQVGYLILAKDLSRVLTAISLLKAGIGTYTVPRVTNPMMTKLHRIMDTIVGKNLNAHVMGGSINCALKGLAISHHATYFRWIQISDAKL